ncbi:MULTISPECIES: 3-methyl-2-oxobutanoate hydroxymethyltransferase [Glutamicibacter]|uniref:3-methyl-2-oxobutanoate hydroxymethyltransferase n=1 Tax=Glutamicibacter TaxID=1742989 RepID=UPI0005796BA1|nr:MULTISPECIES: 3-methyl-2-oxobutanoate hydroxymethyltransferase [Glutamicibacter]KWR69539.1 3-methyl-2-oxobutanoate hydroxymethyltransferase [Arthrobacter sp. W1]QEP07586.1 3-methyl-2-oxobutanoate hydroxymethyltransferase [Glutamicibacter sp. ZJUTW]UTM46874.1 3-methyl-2-oxobutanoate hydroxymethyltransferase [Glutamicibacter mysorens]WIV42767.1 3-methyl-2-oxobutanoate hydroxymethyltransferase [Glutamicibacter nicotianae]
MPQPYLGIPEKGPSRIRLHHLQKAKDNGEKFAMLTAYDVMMAEIFDSAGIEILLVGDSAANTVLGYESTLPISLDEMIVFTKAVANGAKRALVVADLPFGSYEQSPAQAVATAVRLMKEGHAHAVKMEGTAQYAEHVRAMVLAGVPVIGHIGFTPQSEHALGGYRVQGRGDAVAQMKHDAVALQDAGAFCILMEMVPSPVAAEIDAALKVPTIGIGAGNSTTGQVLVWQDMLGLGGGRTPRFVKKYADLREVIGTAVREYHQDVVAGAFPSAEYEFKE